MVCIIFLGSFSKKISEISESISSIHSFKLSMTHGVWGMQEYGSGGGHHLSPIISPPGAELTATFDNNAGHDIDRDWAKLASFLAGMFCSSLDGMKSAVEPHTLNQDPNFITKYGMLSKELLCSENIVPWKSLISYKVHFEGHIFASFPFVIRSESWAS